MEAIDRWRAIILYGRNVATYKIALGKVAARPQRQRENVGRHAGTRRSFP